MKKTFKILAILAIAILSIFTVKVNAASLDAIDITTDKQIVNPESEVKIKIVFGEDLGAFTFDIAYDNNLLEYVSTDTGTANDTGTKVRITYYDQAGGTNPKRSLTVTFKAKAGITTSNPTDLSVTAEGLANADASEQYDDITTPIVKNIVVEPQYVDYDIKLEYTEAILPNIEKEMKLSIVSSMGKYYDHARIVAQATTPSGATAKLLGTDEQGVEHDILDSGWGDASGYEIGGNVNKVLSLRGVFSQVGQYSITVKLIDRDNSDTAIATKTFDINVTNNEVTTPGTNEEEKPSQTPGTTAPKEEKEPETLPKTGTNIYAPLLVASIIVLGICIRTNKKYSK